MQSLRFYAAVLVLGLSAAVLLSGCGQKPVATVNGKDITMDSYVNEIERVQLPNQPPEAARTIGEAALNKIVTEEVILQTAEKENLLPSDKDIELDVSGMLARDPSFEKKLKMMGRTLEDVKKDSRVEQALVNLYTKGVKISQKEIDEAYKKEKDMLPHTIPPIAKAQWIVLPNLEEARKVIQMLDKGASFNMVAQEKSVDPESKARGGEIEPVLLLDVVPNMDPVLGDALKKLPIGKYSEPIDVGGYYFIVKVNDRSKPKVMPREFSNWAIKRQLAMQKAAEKQKPIDQFINDLKSKAKVDILRDTVKNALKQPAGM